MNAVRQSRPPAHESLRMERHLVDRIPDGERHGTIIDQCLFWFLSNFQFYSVALGFVGPSLGLSFGYAVLAATVGILTGTIFTALHASQGPELGYPQMIQSRAQFGTFGSIIPLLGSLFTFLAFNVVDTILIAQGLGGLLGWDYTLTAVGLALLGLGLALYGHDWLHKAFRLMFWVSLPLYVVLSVALFGHATGPTGGAAAAAHGFNAIAFAAQFAASFAYNITYAPCVSDYTRYLPATTSRLRLILGVYGGATVSAIWLVALGAWLAASTGASDSLVALETAGESVFRGFGMLLALISASALATTMGLNAYSAMLTLVTGINSVRPIRNSRRFRITMGSIIAALWLGIALSVRSNAVEALYASLSLALNLLLPWTAINLTDYFLIHGKDDQVAAIDSAPRWKWRGVVAYAIGFAASLPFVVLGNLFEGGIAVRLHGVDISWFPGLVVSAGVYAVLSRLPGADAPAAHGSDAQISLCADFSSLPRPTEVSR